MASLLEELQADFAADGDEDEELQEDDSSRSQTPKVNGGNLTEALNGVDKDMDLDGEGEEDEDIDDQRMVTPNEDILEAEEEERARIKLESKERETPKNMQKVEKFLKDMEPILERVNYFQSLAPEQQTKNIGSVEDNAEYQLLTKSNTFSTSIDDHAADVHKFIRDHYSSRFPELETLLPDPLEYTKAVRVIGNGPMDKIRELSESTDNALGQPLSGVLSRPKLMTVTVEATTSKGHDLPPYELKAVQSACDIMLRLESAKKILTTYVQSRMNLFAPNLTRLIGSLTAAQLLNARGGLTLLANTRASNIPAIGSRRGASGLATNVGVRNQGFLYESALLSRFRPELRTQAMRIISAKIVLAARVDRVHESPSGATGDQLREDCEKRLDKLTEPPPNKGQRALPAPDDKPSRKRGGRRARKAKEATMMTDLRKAQNRMAFGREERETDYSTGDGTKGLGMMGQSDDGRIRSMHVDQRTRAKLSKKNQGWGAGGSGTASTLAGSGGAAAAAAAGAAAPSGTASTLKGMGLRTSGVGTTAGGTAGTTSSLAFTPKQGLELVDPRVRAEMQRQGKADEDRWFKGGTFTQVGGGASTIKTGTATAAGFKVPPLPAKKKT